MYSTDEEEHALSDHVAMLCCCNVVGIVRIVEERW